MAHGVSNKVECSLPASSGVTRSSDATCRFVKSRGTQAGNVFTELIKPKEKSWRQLRKQCRGKPCGTKLTYF